MLSALFESLQKYLVYFLDTCSGLLDGSPSAWASGGLCHCRSDTTCAATSPGPHARGVMGKCGIHTANFVTAHPHANAGMEAAALGLSCAGCQFSVMDGSHASESTCI